MWSKLQKQLYLIIDENANFQIHCSVLKTKSGWGAGQKSGISKKREMIPRYWITVNKEIIWDFPNNFLDYESQVDSDYTIKNTIYWDKNYTWVANTIKEYLDTPKNEVFEKEFKQDKYGLTNCIKKYDRRISKSKRESINITRS